MDKEEKYSIEYCVQVWNDKHGNRYEVHPDRDGLDLVEMCSITDDGKTEASFTMTRECAVKFHEALGKSLGLVDENAKQD